MLFLQKNCIFFYYTTGLAKFLSYVTVMSYMEVVFMPVEI